MRLRFGLAAWSNGHFDNALYPIGTLHDEYLPRYAGVFDCVEADILHHKRLSAAELAAWAAQTPDGFQFLPKLHKDVTHAGAGAGPQTTLKGRGRVGKNYAWLNPQLPEEPVAKEQQMELDIHKTTEFLELLEPLRSAGRLGPILLQFPPAFERVAGWDRMLAILSAAPPKTFAVEVRHTSWFVPAFENLLEDFDAPLVWSTFPKAFAPPWRTSSYGYLRLTGTLAAKRGRHVVQADRGGDVRELAGRLKQAGWDEAFVVVTNGFEGNAVDSLAKAVAGLGARTLAKRLERPPASVLLPDPPGSGARGRPAGAPPP